MSPSHSANAPWGLGFHTARDGVDPGDLFFVTRLLGLKSLEGFLIQGWDIILPGHPWLHEPQPISDQPMGSGFYTRALSTRVIADLIVGWSEM